MYSIPRDVLIFQSGSLPRIPIALLNLRLLNENVLSETCFFADLKHSYYLLGYYYEDGIK